MSSSFTRVYDIAKISFAAAIIAVSAWVSIPFGAVPITLQTFAVFVATGVLGAKKSFYAVCVYVCLGLLGLPVFSGFQNGAAALFGATGGYIFGLAAIPPVSGFLIKKTGKMLVSFLVGVTVCYAIGTAWYVLIYLENVAAKSIGSVLLSCVVPFIVPDILKSIMAYTIVKSLNKRGNYGYNR